MYCSKCGSYDVNVTMQQTSSKLRTKNPGCLWSIGRALLIICTLGLWKIIGSRRSTTHGQYDHEKVAVCQNCGYSWQVHSDTKSEKKSKLVPIVVITILALCVLAAIIRGGM